MTKNELMELSRECGLEFCEEECAKSVFVSLAQFRNAILESAAIQFKDDDDWSESRYTGYAVSEKIRSLKLPTN